MATPDLNKLRQQITAGAAGQRPFTAVPRPVEVAAIPVAPAPPAPPRPFFERADDWLDHVFEKFSGLVMKTGAALGFCAGVYNSFLKAGGFGDAIGMTLGSAIGGFFIAGIGFLLIFLALRKLIEYRHAVAVIGFLVLAANIVRACSR